ncbi:GH92 family glycosyl hydrolase [Pedobacter cryophilus]|uniref:Glycoside hydrolase family 92 protein n=1 Tax=Pedobacter cryophilus TaxID=2571271 RepID=A0A4U1C0C8_9SPHI|nr:GH92 family glycosyl hydrolase [Pedobacter cryophilus]TKB96380.1 glycoside hydrolase family 92 protein [Pedobacter cryophilus]
MMLNYKFIAAILFLGSSVFAQNKTSNLSYVDPTIGGVGVILEPTRPVVHLPNSMLRVYPMKKDQLDDQISQFPLNVASHRIAWVFSFLPVCDSNVDKLWTARFSIEKEQTTPYYYQAEEEISQNTVEFTPTAKCGFFQTKFNNKADKYLRLGIWGSEGQLNVSDKRVITGTESFSGMKAYFYGETDTDIEQVKFQDKNQHKLLARVSDNTASVGFKYGISYISIEQAKQNLYKEIPGWDFNAIKNNAYITWDKLLDQVQIKGGSLAQKRVFYTSLYRSYERVVDINEYGQYYSAYDHKIHQSKEPFFVDNWLWDTYIALEPLHMILNPKQEAEKIRSYIDMYKQGGWMPSFAVTFGDWPAMTGNNAAIWMSDAWFKGIKDFDLKTAYEGMKKNSLQGTILPWRNGAATSLDSFYNKNGYMPGLKIGETEPVKEVDAGWEKRQSVSVTLDNSYSDWCIANLASYNKNKADQSLFLKRSENYKNVFRVEKGFMWPKDKDGNWIEPFEPKLAGREYFTENNAYNFNWDVKHDFKGLFALMGGRKNAEEKLDQLFREELGLPKYKYWYTQPDASGLVGQYVMGNEPGLHIPYLYNYTGSPWKTQKRIRMLLDTWFTDNLFGMPGDEDGGGMSAFVVFSMMGFFPVTPGVPVYNIGSPIFDRVSIRLTDGSVFEITAVNNSAENKYIQKASLNGKDLNKPWFTHEDLIKGGKLVFVMGNKPNTEWGNSEDAAPLSIINK